MAHNAVAGDASEAPVGGVLLTEREDRFRRALEAAHAMVYEINLSTGELVDIHGFAAVLGYDSADKPISLRGWLGFVHPEDRAEVTESMRTARVAPSAGYSRHFRLRHGSGRYIWVEDTGRVYPGADNQELRAIGTLVDITRRKEAEDARRESEERFRVAQELSLDAFTILVAVRNRDGKIVDFRWRYVNPVAARVLNRPREELEGQCLLDVLPGNKSDSDLFARYVKVVETGMPHDVEIPYEADGISGWYRNMTVKLDDGVAIYFSDISARKAAERDQRFLLALGDVLLQPSSEDELLLRITGALARHMRAALCLFGEVDRVAHAVHLRRFEGAERNVEIVAISLDDMEAQGRAELEAGRAVYYAPFPTLKAVSPTAASPAMGLSCLGVPLMQNGLWIAGLWVLAEGPRAWSERDVALLQAVIDRTQLALDAVRAEAALRRSEARFRATFEQAPVGVIQLDADGRVTMANPAYCTMLGFAAGELVGRSPSEWTHPEDIPTAQLLRKRLLSGQLDNYSYEKRYIRKDGVTIWAQVNAAVIADGAKHPTAAVNIAQDITLRRQSEEQIAYQAFILRNVRDAVIALDAEERITVWNSGAEELYGWQADEALGRSVSQLVRTESTPDRRNETRRAMARGAPSSVETIHHHRDGSAIHVEVLATALYDASGSVMGYVGISRDITERKRFEMALQQLNETLEVRVAERTVELERSNRELDQFAYVASHDLKAPLRAIATLANWIADDAAALLPEASLRHLAKLQGRIARMDALLDDLLSYSRAGRMRHPLEWVDTARLVHDVVELLAPPPGLLLHIAPGMPVLLAERVPLETVFRNLIGNAIKHHHDPAHANIVVSARAMDECIEFSVADDGPGIDPAFHERIFAMFQTLRPRDQVEGSGIGLTLVKKLVETRGGTVTLESSEGNGATFRFTWPVTAGE